MIDLPVLLDAATSLIVGSPRWNRIFTAPVVLELIRYAMAKESECLQLNMSLQGRDKAIALLNKGMESQCELMDQLKQEVRSKRDFLDVPKPVE